MSYAGTNKGGTEAIVAAERLVLERRAQLDSGLTAESVVTSFPLAIDRIMGEGGLWDEPTAAAAFLQANGDITEAVHLIRAHRSTLPRLAFSHPLNPRELQLLRRVVSTQRQPDGPILLGETVDYTARILHDGSEPPLPVVDAVEAGDLSAEQLAERAALELEHPADEPFRRFRDYLHDMGVLADRALPTDEEPFDIQMVAPQLPATRSAWLSMMAQADTGALINIWYQGVLGPSGYPSESVTLGEVRHGRLPVRVAHPHTGELVEIGRIRVSETEAVSHLGENRGEDPTTYDIGYAMALGHNERKAIAAACMDIVAWRFRGTEMGKQIEQVLLHTTDGLAASGFLEHLKLPHFVTFQSGLDATMATRAEAEALLRRLAEGGAELPDADAPAEASAAAAAGAHAGHGHDDHDGHEH
jgi:alpha-D-ribose 1-methylphosphonate 5-triphosphate synthase subunit PhnI